ncbi:MAG: transposase-like zinc-binding domain-containing protein [Methylococcales bacterium]
MIVCKRCGGDGAVKNGIVRGQQRDRCRTCAYNFIAGDRRVDDELIVKKALAVILYSLGKASFNRLGHIFGVSRSLTYRGRLNRR